MAGTPFAYEVALLRWEVWIIQIYPNIEIYPPKSSKSIQIVMHFVQKVASFCFACHAEKAYLENAVGFEAFGSVWDPWIRSTDAFDVSDTHAERTGFM